MAGVCESVPDPDQVSPAGGGTGTLMMVPQFYGRVAGDVRTTVVFVDEHDGGIVQVAPRYLPV